MPLVRLSFENYRCFSKRQNLELRPITVVLGKNNSGKSALVRAPLVLSTGFDSDSSLPLDLEQLGEHAPDFVDLIHNRVEHGSVSFGLEVEVPEQAIGKSFDPDSAGSHGMTFPLTIGIDVTIQNVAEWHSQVVSRWTLRSPEGTTSLEWIPEDEAGEEDSHPYSVTGNDLLSHVSSVAFKGLLPANRSRAMPDDLTRSPFPDGRGWLVRAGLDRIRHLGPFRTRPNRVGRLTARLPSQDDDSGTDTVPILIYDHVRRGGRLITKINEYLGEHIPGWELEVVPRYDAYSVGLKSKATAGLWVPATDTGTGVAQVLPILVRRARDELDPPVHSILEIVEEPELHLHPSGQAALADLYVTATQRTPVRFLIETHSETFLLRLRRRVAEGKVDPDMIALYFVEHTGVSATVRRINVDDLGNVDYWPQGIFAEDFEETRALAAAQLGRQDTDAR
ncbi:DUF3696 domain-containing protein [Sphaerisporangium album]|uniref:DUF3696 domain-containing protein n=1 Tax=Sphaerisporangium album TaxID=509200 RepID=A0A367FM92_9ACTN|nr:DUF3696 domain-containing protein [Sphaerisporangium album]RCG31384.1 DUF3696 domain-containing protein [Sphaerisporangium album]